VKKDLIKKLLREVFIPEAPTTKQKPGEKSDTSGGATQKKKKKVDTYPDVRRAMNKKLNPTASTQVGVMKAIGIPDDKKGVNRGLFNKKLRRKKNPDSGSIYKFDEEELTGVRRALDIT
tara:strand:- start:2109 stop:2465 length:357 start_codon:yes stop_codon:yes gene_type:complete